MEYYGWSITEIMLRTRDEPCLEVRKAKISRISNQDPFMGFWTYRNSFRIWHFQRSHIAAWIQGFLRKKLFEIGDFENDNVGVEFQKSSDFPQTSDDLVP